MARTAHVGVDGDQKGLIAEFKASVNLTARQLETWLGSDESREVGSKLSEGSESVGHHSGRRIIEILGKKRSDYSEEDFQHMAKVVGYIHRHLAQRPDGDIERTPWRYSLMNWGHDPSKKPKASRAGRSKASK